MIIISASYGICLISKQKQLWTKVLKHNLLKKKKANTVELLKHLVFPILYKEPPLNKICIYFAPPEKGVVHYFKVERNIGGYTFYFQLF